MSGRISQVERNEEQPSQDIFSILSKIMIGIMIVVPFIALFFLTGAMSFAFAILGLRTLSHLFNPIIWATSLFEFFEIMVLARIRGTDLVPIYRGSVQDSNGQETFFYFRGPLQHGNLIQGNRVEFRGRDNNGTFVVSQGRDLTTNALISSTYRNPWRVIFYVLICVYIGLLGVMYAASWPHVQ